MDFLKELNNRIRKINTGESKVKPVIEGIKGLYNIHKRSLPVGIDKIVVVGVTKVEANRLMETMFKSKVYIDQPKDSKTLIYYDVLPQDATAKERSIYFNERPVMEDQK